MSDAMTCGRRFRIFAVVDDFTRECVRLITDTSISGARVSRGLDIAILERPLARRVSERDVVSSLGHAREVLAEWRHDYIHYRPHSSLGNMTPAEMAAKSDGKPGWWLTPNPVIAFTPNTGHQKDQRLQL